MKLSTLAVLAVLGFVAFKCARVYWCGTDAYVPAPDQSPTGLEDVSNEELRHMAFRLRCMANLAAPLDDAERTNRRLHGVCEQLLKVSTEMHRRGLI